jgi:hypothetical protein
MLWLSLAASSARANGAHHLKAEATELVRMVLSGQVAQARQHAEPYARVKAYISVTDADYNQALDSLLKPASFPPGTVLKELVIDDVFWHPSSKQIFACVRAIFSQPVAPAWKLPVCFHLDGAWKLVGFSAP